MSSKKSAPPRAPTSKAKTIARRTKAKAATPAAKHTGFNKRTIALVYDFDGTLSPRPMQEYAFLPSIGEDPAAFWRDVGAWSTANNADPMLVYMRRLYERAREKNVKIDRADLVAQGKAVEYFPGVEAWFDAVAKYVADHDDTDGIILKHYLISAGLREIVEGTSIYKHFDNAFASEYWFDAYDMPYPKRVITDTGKTQYLFRINKGIEDERQTINHHMPEDARPIPFSNMVYFGDGDTDVPSMAVMRKNGGHAVAVYPPGGNDAKCVELFGANRVDFYATADFRVKSDLFRRTCLLLDAMIANIRLDNEIWHLRNDARGG